MRVSLSPAPSNPGPLTAAVLADTPDDVPAALAFAPRLGEARAVPGDGTTADQWEALATLAAHDLGVARAIEPHLDAIGILTQAGRLEGDTGTWGVFAAEGGPDPLTATAGDGDGSWRLEGTKPWCSLAGSLDSALVTAGTADGERRLFAVDLRAPGISVDTAAWVARGLSEIPSGPVHFSDVAADAVGEPGWYLSRPGFALGGIGVAACWFGGAVALGRTLADAVAAKPDPLRLAHLGAVDEALQSARRALKEAAESADDHTTDGRILAKRVRATVARTCEEVLSHCAHALGPAPLALDARHAKRVADLELYVRQHHAEHDLASLGQAVVDSGRPW
jgi:alkylation response protein AidB-like acyl-CoA dehydrogenase